MESKLHQEEMTVSCLTHHEKKFQFTEKKFNEHDALSDRDYKKKTELKLIDFNRQNRNMIMFHVHQIDQNMVFWWKS